MTFLIPISLAKTLPTFTQNEQYLGLPVMIGKYQELSMTPRRGLSKRYPNFHYLVCYEIVFNKKK